jgi:hypothetical protein
MVMTTPPTDDESSQAALDSERLRQIAEWLRMEQGHEETAKRVDLIADRHDRLAVVGGIYECSESGCNSALASDRPIALRHHGDGSHEVFFRDGVRTPAFGSTAIPLPANGGDEQ